MTNATRPRPFAPLAAACLLAACAGGGGGGLALPTPGETRGVPGFDTRDYPGDQVMRAWLAESPYRWVGYYLPAPCYTGATWLGKRTALEGMGWGVAVVFVGEQDWSADAAEAADGEAPPRCTRANLTAAKGEEDGAQADAQARAEGFGPGTAIYLDVERVESVSPELEAYVAAWTRELVRRGRYVPALYAHARNAEALHAAMARESPGPSPRLWVARQEGFDLRKAPGESGFPRATAWQGVFDATEEWGGTALRIDVNVATSASPSR